MLLRYYSYKINIIKHILKILLFHHYFPVTIILSLLSFEYLFLLGLGVSHFTIIVVAAAAVFLELEVILEK